MQKKVLFGFDYTDNEFVKIILYLFVGGSAALIEWAFFYAFSEAAGINYLAATALAYFLSTLYHYFMCNILVFTSGVRYGRAKELRGALWQGEGTESGVPRQRHGAFV